MSGRKIYFIPKEISKENAIKYLTKELGIEYFYAVGDSIMDYGMLNISNKSYVLKHGDINKNEIENSFISSSFNGMSGTEEILSNYSKVYHTNLFQIFINLYLSKNSIC